MVKTSNIFQTNSLTVLYLQWPFSYEKECFQAVFQLEKSLVNILLDYAAKLQGKLARIKK